MTEEIFGKQNEHKEHNEEYIKHADIKENKLKIMFEKYLLSFHNQLLEFLPVPYDYICMFLLGYFFMKLITQGKSSIYVKNKKKLDDPNVFEINKKLREISQKLTAKKNVERKKSEKKVYTNMHTVDLGKLEEIENKLNKLMNDLSERNKNNSQEKVLQNDICELQTKILDEIKKRDEDDEEEEEDYEEEKEKENNKI